MKIFDSPDGLRPGRSLRVLRVLVAEDHAVVRSALAALLTADASGPGGPGLEVVALAADGEEAVEGYRRHLPDVALLDMRMPRMSGAQACAAIRSEFPAARVVILSSFDGDEDVHRALSAGASGYLPKGAEPRELAAALRRVAAGGRHLPEHVAARLAESVGAPRLTGREHEVLRLIAGGKTNAQIARALIISEGTVKTHVNSIMSKMGAADRTRAVVLGLQRGLLSLEEPEWTGGAEAAEGAA